MARYDSTLSFISKNRRAPGSYKLAGILGHTFLGHIERRYSYPLRINPPVRMLLCLHLVNVPFYFLFAFFWVSEVARMIMAFIGILIVFGFIILNRSFYILWKTAYGRLSSWLLLHLATSVLCHAVVIVLYALPGVKIV